MKHQQKIIGAIKSAINHLESSMNCLVNSDENGVTGAVWRAAADLEYANFLFSVMQDESESRSWKLDLRSKQVEIGPLLVSTQDLLREAEIGLDVGKLHEVYKKTWMARGYLLKVQEILEKRRKKGEKSSSTS
ncbi:MAG: hypothetical protein OEX76_01615 [Candidatus Bathyarchaeota archaeon]|nr:hypothetical protein [Candidatus Bathyarchaeota archaeon]